MQAHKGLSAAAETGVCPVLGAYDPLSPDELHDPYPGFARARASAPVFYSEALDLWSIARQADVLAVLRDSETFSASGALPHFAPPDEVRDRMPEYPWVDTVVTMDGAQHKWARSLLQAPFTPKSLRAWTPTIRDRARTLFLPLSEGRRMEFLSEYAYPLALSSLADVLGIPAERHELLKRGVDHAFRLIGDALTDSDEVLASAQEVADLYDYMSELVEDRRAAPRDDYTSVMLRTAADAGSPEPTARMVKHVWTLIGAGFDTTANMLGQGVRAMLEHRDQWQRLIDHRDLIDNAVEEALRYRTLVKRIYRVTTCDVTVGDVPIPRGARVALLLASANRDEEGYADDPNRFDIAKRRENLGFGKWKHFCVGAPLARLEMKLTLEALLELAPHVRLVPGQPMHVRPELRTDAMTALYIQSGQVDLAGPMTFGTEAAAA